MNLAIATTLNNPKAIEAPKTKTQYIWKKQIVNHAENITKPTILSSI